jgi:hypothetical protein
MTKDRAKDESRAAVATTRMDDRLEGRLWHYQQVHFVGGFFLK